jgi:hypothetical protein
VPTALDDLVGAAHLRKRHRQNQRSGGLEIDDQLNSGRLVEWQVNRFGALTGAFVFELRPTEWCELADRRARRLIPSCFGGLRLRRWSSAVERQNPSHGGPFPVNDPKGIAFGGSM